MAAQTIAARWNEVALEAVRLGEAKPTEITRALHIFTAAMYDAHAAYDPDAAPAYVDIPLTGPVGKLAQATAVSLAAHDALIAVFPDFRFLFDTLLRELEAEAAALGVTPPAEARAIGSAAAAGVVAARAEDGSNAGDDYRDTSDYEPVNRDEADALSDPNHWTPLRVPNGTVRDEWGIPVATDNPATYDLQKPLSPHWGSVSPFAIAAGDAYRSVAPPKLGDFSVYVDQTGKVTTGDAAYRAQFGEVLEISAGLTTEQKVIAEYWADGPRSSTPPGHWNEIAQDIALREGHDMGTDVKFFFALNAALFDAGIAVWDSKYAHDYVRPQTAIRHLFEGQEVEAWLGPNCGIGTIDGGDWQPYQDVTFVTPPFPEYGSGHSGFSYAGASIIAAFTGTDAYFDGTSRGAYDEDGDGEADLIGRHVARDLRFEAYDGPPVTLTWDTVWDAAADAGRSRLYGGIHVQDGDLSARKIGVQVAGDVWARVSELFTQDGSREVAPAPGTPRLDLGTGHDVLVGGLDALDGLRVLHFGADDAIRIQGLTLGDDRLAVKRGSAILEIDENGDGVPDGTITLEGDFDGDAFRAYSAGGETTITLAGAGDVGLTAADESFRTAATDGVFVSAGGGDDSVQGGSGDDVIDGDGGDDLLTGGDGADTLIGGAGDDTLGGESGSDTFSIARADGGGTDVILDYEAGIDVIELAGFGPLRPKTVTLGREADNSLRATFDNGQSVILRGVTDPAQIDLRDLRTPEDGRNLVYSGLDRQRLTEADDAFIGGDGAADAVEAGAGDDLIQTRGGDDTITGGAGSDTLEPGAGADLIRILGADVTGGAGSTDVLRGFTSREDKVQFIGIPGVAGLGDLAARLTDVDGNIALDFGGGHRLVFEGITSLRQLSPRDAILGGDAPEIVVALTDDTGDAADDGVTSVVGLSGSVADDVGIDTLEVSVDGGNFLDITFLLRTDGSFRIPSEAVERRLAEGAHALRFRVTDLEGKTATSDLDLVLDTEGPAVTDGLGITLDDTTDRLIIGPSEALSDAPIDPDAFVLTDAEGARIAVSSVDRGSDDRLTLNLEQTLESGTFTLAGSLTDRAGNSAAFDGDVTIAAATRVVAVRPANGSERANLDGKITVEFNRPIDPDTIDADSIAITALGAQLEGRYSVSSDGTLVTFFPAELLPGATSVRVAVAGERIMGADGEAVQSVPTATFSTISLTRVANTNVEGFIFDANYRDEDGLDIPLEGVVVSVIGLPGVTATTDANGRFFLEDLPFPQVYLDFDASGVTNRPNFDYGTITKPVDTVAGQTVGLGSGAKAFNIYFAALAEADITALMPGEATEAGIGENGLANLTEIFPGIDPAQWSKLKVTIPADSLTLDDGTPIQEVAVMAFEPDRIPAPLPPGFDPTVVFTVKAGDATNVDGKAQIEFPNLDDLPLGAKRPILSFDHDAGVWVETGIVVVVEDGQGGTVMVSEGDSGVNTLGWKAVGDDPDNCGGAGDAPAPPPDDPDGPPTTETTVNHLTLALITKEEDSFAKLSFTAPGEIEGPLPPPSDDGCEAPNEEDEEEEPRQTLITITADPSVLQFMKSTGNLDLSGGRHTFNLRPGDANEYTLDFDPIPIADLLGTDGYKGLNENRLYSGEVLVRKQVVDSDGNVTVTEDKYFLSRFIDATDKDHDDVTISMARTVADGAEGVVREVPLETISGGPGDPILTVGGTDAADFKVSATDNKITFDPTTGTGVNLRTATAEFEVFNPNKPEDSAGKVALSGKTRNVQEAEVDFTEFKAVVASAFDTTTGTVTPFNAIDTFSAAQRRAIAALFDDTAPTAPETRSQLRKTFDAILADANSYFSAAGLKIEIVEAASDTNFIDVNWQADDGDPTDIGFGIANGALRSNDIGVVKIKALQTTGNLVHSEHETLYRLDEEVNKIYSGDIDLYFSELLNDAAGAVYSTPSATASSFYNSTQLTSAVTDLLGYTIAHEVGHHLGLTHAFKTGGAALISGKPNDIMNYPENMTAFPPTLVASGDLAAFSLYGTWNYMDYFADAYGYVIAGATASNFIGQSRADAGDVARLHTIAGHNDHNHDGARGAGDDLAYEITPDPGQDFALLDGDAGLFAGTIDFGEVTLGADVPPISLTVLSLGADPIAGIGPDGAVAGSPFGVASATFDPPLEFGDQATIEFTFDASTPGSFESDVPFATLAGTKFDLAFSGTVVSPDPILTLIRPAENFGDTAAAGGQVTQTYTIANEGRGTLTVASLAISDAQFTLSGLPDDIVLEAGESLDFDVTFDPDDAGLTTATLTFDSNTGALGTQAVTLNGTGRASGATVWGDDYVLVEIGTLELRARSDASGDFEFRLPSDTDYKIQVLDPVSGLIAEGFGTTAPLGRSTDLTSSLVYRATRGPDTDGDGLTDEIEDILGSRSDDPDTNGDDISDFRALELGFDPQEGVGFPTGIIATVELQGEARDVILTGAVDEATGQTAYVATGSHGLAIIDAGEFTGPILQSELDLPGDAQQVAADAARALAFVAAGAGGLHVVDVSDPVAPVLRSTTGIAGGAQSVVNLGGTVLVGGGLQMALVNATSGARIATYETGGRVNDIAVDGDTVYAIVGNQELVSWRIAGAGLTELDRITFPQSTIRTVPEDKTVFIDNGVAYVANGLEVSNVPLFRLEERGGYLTYDVSDPTEMALISNIDTPRVQSGNLETVLNGSGLALVAGGFRGLQVHDASDPEVTYNLLQEFSTPGSALGVSVASGIVYVADGTGGLQVINALPYDTGGQAPEVSIDADAADADPDTTGIQVEEGTRIGLDVSITDDVQVRNVELLLDGEVVRNDVSAPFTVFFDVPPLASLEDTQLQIQVRATDTGGNATITAPITVEVIEDFTPPELLAITPGDDRLILRGRELFTVAFSERIDPDSFAAGDVTLTPEGSDVSIAPAGVVFFDNGPVAQIAFDPLALGAYDIDIDLTRVLDLAGNPIADGEVVSQGFQVVDATAIWDAETGGIWNVAENWANDAVPTADDGVAIVLADPGAVEINSDATAEDIVLDGRLVLSSGQLTTQKIEGSDGTFVHRSGTLSGAVLDGSDSFAVEIGLFDGRNDFGAVWSGVTLATDALLRENSLRVEGGLTLDGTLTVSSQSYSGAGYGFGRLDITPGTTVGGTGTIRLQGPSATLGTGYNYGTPATPLAPVTLGEDITIAGNGQIRGPGAGSAFQILGEIRGDDGGLRIDRIDQNGGSLSLSSTSDGWIELRDEIQNLRLDIAQGADIRATTGRKTDLSIGGPGSLIMSGGVIDGLTVRAGGTAVADTTGTYSTQVNLYGNLTVDGTLGVEGRAGSVQGGGITLRDTTLIDGAGTIRLGQANATDGSGADSLIQFRGAGSYFNRAADRLTIGEDITLSGAGRLAVSAADDRLNILGNVVGDDQGTDEALYLERIDQQGGTLEIDATDGAVYLSRSLERATITGDGIVDLESGIALRDVRVDGRLRVAASEIRSVDANSYGGIDVDGELIIAATEARTAHVRLFGEQTIGGTGRIALEGGTRATLFVENLDTAAREISTIGADVTIFGDGTLTSRNNQDAFAILGTLQAGEEGRLTVSGVDNDGAALRIDASDGDVVLSGLIRDASVEAAGSDAGRVTLGDFARLSRTVLEMDAELDRLDTSDRVFASEGLTLNAELLIEADAGQTNWLEMEGEQTLDGNGTIRLVTANPVSGSRQSAEFYFDGLLASAETLTVGQDITIVGDGTISSADAGDLIDIEGDVIARGGIMALEDLAALEGTLRAEADGVLSYRGDFALSERGTLGFGLTAGGTGVMNVTGALTLDGTLALDVDGFDAALGDTVELITARTLEGAFQGFEGLDLDGNLAFEVISDTDGLSLRVTDDATARAGGFIGGAPFVPAPRPTDTRTDIALDRIETALEEVRLVGPETPGTTPVLVETVRLSDVVLATDVTSETLGRGQIIRIEQGLTLDDATMAFLGDPDGAIRVDLNGTQTIGGTGTLDFTDVDGAITDNVVTARSLTPDRESFVIGADVTIVGDVTLNGLAADPLSILGTLRGRAGDVLIANFIDNAGGTLTVDAEDGVVGLGGALRDTRLEGTGTVQLRDNITLSDVTLATDLAMTGLGGFRDFTVRDGLTFDGGTLRLDARSDDVLMRLAGSQTIDGAGRIQLGMTGTEGSEIRFDGLSALSETLTLGEAVEISGTGTLRALSRDDAIALLGTVAAEGGDLSLSQIDNGGEDLRIRASDHSVRIGDLRDTRVTAEDGASVVLSSNGTLEGVTFATDVDFLTRSDRFDTVSIVGGLTLDDSDLTVVANVRTSAALTFTGAQAIGGTGALVLEPTVDRPDRISDTRLSFQGTSFAREEIFSLAEGVDLRGAGRLDVSTGDILRLEGDVTAEGGLLLLGTGAGIASDVTVAADGTLRTADSLGLEAGQTLTMALAGAGADARAGLLTSNRDVAVGGTFAFDLAAGFDAALGTEFTLITTSGNGSLSGRFDAVTGATFGEEGKGLALVFDADAVRAVVVSGDAAGGQFDTEDQPGGPPPALPAIVTEQTIDAAFAGAQLSTLSGNDTWRDVTLESDVLVSQRGLGGYGRSSLRIEEAFTLDGSLIVDGAGARYGYATVTMQSGLTVDGSGTIDLRAVRGGYYSGSANLQHGGSADRTGGLVTLGEDVSILGSGRIAAFGNDRWKILGDVTAKQGRLQLSQVDNEGAALQLSSVDGGLVSLTGFVENTDITVTAGARVVVEGATMNGSTVSGPGTLDVVGGGSAAGLSVDGTLRVSSGAQLGVSDLDLDGTLELVDDGSSFSTLLFDGTQTVDGTGTLRLSREGLQDRTTSDARVFMRSTDGNVAEVLTFAEGIDITGAGTLFAASQEDAIRILGTVVADDAEAPLQLDGIDQDGGTLTVDARVGQVAFGSRLTDTTLVGQGEARFAPGLRLDGVTVDMTVGLFGIVSVLSEGGLTVDGTLGMVTDEDVLSRLDAQGTQTIGGEGTIDLSFGTVSPRDAIQDPFGTGTPRANELRLLSQSADAETLTIGADLTVTGAGRVLANGGNDTIAFLGTAVGSTDGRLELFDIDNGGAALTIDASDGPVILAGTVANTILRAADGQTGTAQVSTNTFFSAVTVDIGLTIGDPFGNRAIYSSDGLQLDAQVTLEAGPSNRTLLEFDGAQTLSGSASIRLSDALIPEGVTTTADNRVTFDGQTNDAEVLVIGSGIEIVGEGIIDVYDSGDSIDLNGQIIAEGGALSVERLDGVDGTLGARADGALAVSDGFVFNDTGRLLIGVDEDGAGRVTSGAAVALDGTLRLTGTDGLTLALGDEFEILSLSRDTISGAFSRFEGFDLAGDLAFELVQSDTSLVLRVTTDADAAPFL